LSDYQALVCTPDFSIDPRVLVKGARLAAWDFGHLLRSQDFFTPFQERYHTSPVINLAQGYDAYVSERATESQVFKKCNNLSRRLEREIGPLQFLVHSTGTDLLGKVMDWKSQQYIASSKPDLLREGWLRSVIERIHQMDAENCAGVLSLLYAGDILVAGHFGMRSKTLWHYWFPAYDPDYAKYSPGLLLLLKMAEHASVLGLSAIDLGMGASLYKDRLANGSIALASGSVEVSRLLSFQRRTKRRLRALVLNAGFETPARKIYKLLQSKSPDGS
jgi:CelD/BcsL family acetyltransferase involved in cellulose biosynthesis